MTQSLNQFLQNLFSEQIMDDYFVPQCAWNSNIYTIFLKLRCKHLLWVLRPLYVSAPFPSLYLRSLVGFCFGLVLQPVLCSCFEAASTPCLRLSTQSLTPVIPFFLGHKATKMKFLQRFQYFLVQDVTRAVMHHNFNRSSLHWLKIPEHIHIIVIALCFNSLQYLHKTSLKLYFWL